MLFRAANTQPFSTFLQPPGILSRVGRGGGGVQKGLLRAVNGCGLETGIEAGPGWVDCKDLLEMFLQNVEALHHLRLHVRLVPVIGRKGVCEHGVRFEGCGGGCVRFWHIHDVHGLV